MSRLHLSVPCIALAAALAALPAAAQEAPTAAQEGPIKLAVVNLDLIAAEAPAGKDLRSKLEAFQGEIRAELERLAAEAQGIRQRLSEGANTLSDERLSELQKNLEDNSIAVRRYQDDKQREGQKMQAEGLKAIELELEPVFRAISDEAGYDLIINNTPGFVIMAGPRVDITQTVVERLRALSSGE